MIKYFSSQNLERLDRILGSYELIKKKSIFNYVLTTAREGDFNKLNIILPNQNFPHFAYEIFIRRFLQAFCHGIITSVLFSYLAIKALGK